MGPARRRLFYFLQELRAEFLTASLLPAAAGTALAYYHTGRCRWNLLALCLAAVGLVHSGANVLNDYCDSVTGNDACNTDFARPFTGGSRLIQDGLLSRREVLTFAIVLLGAGLLAGLWLAWLTGPLVLWLGLAGIAGGILYSLPRVGLGAHGLGEPAVAVLFGVLPLTGSYYVQTGTVTTAAVALALPLAVLVAAVLFINQFQDVRADAAVGKRTWVVRLGLRRAAHVFAVLMGLWAGVLAAGVALRLIPVPALTGLFPVPLGAYAAVHAHRAAARPRELVPANRATVLLNFCVTALIAVTLAASRALFGSESV